VGLDVGLITQTLDPKHHVGGSEACQLGRIKHTGLELEAIEELFADDPGPPRTTSRDPQ
jgi:hypothetical protein